MYILIYINNKIMQVSFITNDENMISINKRIENQDEEIDEFEFGVEEQNLAINYDDNIQLEPDEIINQFYIDLRGGNLKTITWGDIFRNYNSIIIVTHANNKKDNDTSMQKIFNYKIKKNDLETITGITYFRSTINILRNKDHYFKTNIINKTDLIKLFPNAEFNETELVLCIFEMDEDNTRKYCNMYKHSEDIKYVNTKLDIYNYYVSNKNHVELTEMFSHLKNNDYWSQKCNLHINY